MSSIERYVVTADPDEWGDGPMLDYDEARTLAAQHGACVVELTYEYADSELVDDFRACFACGGPISECDCGGEGSA
jgi:hypothetical protein